MLPLKFTLTPASGGAAVVDAGFTKVDFAKPAASTFDFTPPKGAKVTEADELGKGQREPASDSGEARARTLEEELEAKDLEGPGRAPKGSTGSKVIGEGWSSIAELRHAAAEGGMPTGGDVRRRRPGRRLPGLPRRQGQRASSARARSSRPA